MKRALSLMLALVLALSLVPAVHAQEQVLSGFCGGEGNEENVTWRLENGTLTISGTGEMAHYGIGGAALYTPWQHAGRITTVIVEEGVTSLGMCAFDSLSITSISIPRSVTAIYREAIRNCRDLTSFTLPAQVTTFSWDALTMCYGLREINVEPGNPGFCAVDGVLFTKDKKTLIQYPVARTGTAYAVPNGVETINAAAFENGQRLTAVTLPDGLKTIGGDAFSECRALASINLPDSVEFIGEYAFANCLSLTQVNWPAGLEDFNARLFANCKSLASVNIPDGNEHFYSKDGVVFLRSGYDPEFYPTTGPSLIYYPTGKRDAAYTVPDGVTDIGQGAFENNPYLQRVDIPGSVENIFKYAFGNCGNLQEVTFHEGLRLVFPSAFYVCPLRSLALPASLTGLGDQAFGGNSRLETITVAPGNRDFVAADNVLFTKDRATLILYPAKKTDERYVIPDTVTEVAAFAFCYNQGLTFVTIPASVKTLRAGAFQYCSGLNTATFLGSAPKGSQAAYQGTFNGCSDLTAIFYPADDPSWDENAQRLHNGSNAQWLPLGSAMASGTCGAPGNEQNVTWRIQDDVLTISGAGAMRSSVDYDTSWRKYPKLFSRVVIEKGVTSIGDIAFWQCDRLKSVTIPSSVTSVGMQVCGYCPSLTDVYYDGSWEQLDKMSKAYNGDLFAARLHLNFSGELGGMSWSYEDGKVKLAQAPAAGERVLAATYDENGRLVSVKALSASDAAQLTPGTRLKLFWLDARQVPRCPAASAQTGGTQTAAGGGGVN